MRRFPFSLADREVCGKLAEKWGGDQDRVTALRAELARGLQSGEAIGSVNRDFHPESP